MRDILLPQKNEPELAQTAKALGYTHLWLVYKNKASAYTRPLALPYTCLFSTSGKGNTPLCLEADITSIRKIAEHTRPAITHGVELHSPKDHIHQRGSGINHVIARLMSTHNTSYAFGVAPLLTKTPHERAALLGRIRQNIQLFQKYHTTMFIASLASTPEELRSPGDMQSLFRILGMQPHELRAATRDTL